jgi:hypothetical protein
MEADQVKDVKEVDVVAEGKMPAFLRTAPVVLLMGTSAGWRRK